MANLIPRNVYKTIEYRLHTYEQMKLRISEWEAGIQSHNKTPQLSKNQGFYSDPTALTVIKLLNPPNDINKDIKWVHLIDSAKIFAYDAGIDKLFDVWYGKSRPPILSVVSEIPCDKATFYRWRDTLVYWIAFRAVRHNLIHFD